nr:RecName: Full=Non-specific lipid-transfer protein 1; Short=LTP 1 [Nigella sativa]
ISCQDVKQSLAPCLPYVTGRAPKPAPGCCNGINHL